MDHVEHCNCGTVNAVHILGQHADCEYYDHHCEMCHEAGICTATDCTARIDQSVAHWKNETQRQRCRADEAQRDLTTSRRESAALGAMVARLREALEALWKYVRTKHGDWYMSAERREHANRIDAALALTPATVGAYVTALEDLDTATRYQLRCHPENPIHGPKSKKAVEDAIANIDAARALLSDRAPGKDESK